MMAKDSVKSRLETGMSFTEFSYQLVQGYDFYYLNKHKDCVVQLGGSDQWGNIVTGTELIRRKGGGEAFAVTTPLIKKADGSKFGKTEGGNIWLDPERTSPYQFYQYWLNVADEDAGSYIRIFTLKTKEEIESLEKIHSEAPHLRTLQKALAEDITIRAHGKNALQSAIIASNILFGKSTEDDLKSLSEKEFFDIFDGVPQYALSQDEFGEGINMIEALSAKTGFLASNGEARRELKSNAISVNKNKVPENFVIEKKHLINNRYALLGKGKKRNYIIIVE